MTALDKHVELLVRIDERVARLPAMEDQLTSLAAQVKEHGETLAWMGWVVKGLVAGSGGLLLALLAK